MKISRSQAAARAATTSRKLREAGFGPIRADEPQRHRGIRVQADNLWGGARFVINFDGAHTRRSMTKLVRETLVELGYDMDETWEILDNEEPGRDFYGTIIFHAWLPKWDSQLAVMKAEAAKPRYVVNDINYTHSVYDRKLDVVVFNLCDKAEAHAFADRMNKALAA